MELKVIPHSKGVVKYAVSCLFVGIQHPVSHT